MTNEELLGEVEDLLRTVPNSDEFGNVNNLAWLGRAGAVVEAWNGAHAVAFNLNLGSLQSFSASIAAKVQAHRQIIVMLHRARFDLMMKTGGPLSTAIGQGMVFHYFDELRKIIEIAREDVYWIDPYLDAEFVSRYLSHIKSGVAIRLLAREKLGTLMPAVETFAQQNGANIQVRSASGFHDRYVFIDRRECYQSGASFKDGGRTAATTLTQIVDAFAAVQKTYEDLWEGGRVVR